MKRHTPETGSSSFGPPDRHALRRMAGERSFQRGEAYFAGGQVVSLTEHEGTVTAKVEGTRPYRVKLWPEDGEPGFSCTCPVGQDGAFCMVIPAYRDRPFRWIVTDSGVHTEISGHAVGNRGHATGIGSDRAGNSQP